KPELGLPQRGVGLRQARPRAGSTSDAASTITRLFGPLASMHAALDKMGAGTPCALVARFEGRSVAEVERAITAARARFPVLQASLLWRNSTASLIPIQPAVPGEHADLEPLLSFSPGADGGVWRYRLSQDGRDVWLKAAWAHAVADGLSMLRFLRTV